LNKFEMKILDGHTITATAVRTPKLVTKVSYIMIECVTGTAVRDGVRLGDGVLVV